MRRFLSHLSHARRFEKRRHDTLNLSFKYREDRARLTLIDDNPVNAVLCHPTWPVILTGYEDGVVSMWEARQCESISYCHLFEYLFTANNYLVPELSM